MQVFTIAPATSRAIWFAPFVLALVLVPVIGLVGAAILSARTARFEISPAGLRLRGDLYGRLIPAEQLRASAARRVDLSAAPEWAPRWRTLGTGLPGYQAGWFGSETVKKRWCT